MKIAKDKQKEKSCDQKEYQILRSIHDEVEEELHCLKKQQEMLMKLIQREEKKLNIKSDTYLFPIEYQEPKRHYNLRKKHQLSNAEIQLEQKSSNGIKSIIPLSPKGQIQIAESYLYTGSKMNQDLPRKNHRRQDIFRMDEELYEEADQSYDQ